jgi:crotonobetainyl-CoA:carnitine CoA-transferase CaiB-like acyl-CoA transferase
VLAALAGDQRVEGSERTSLAGHGEDVAGGAFPGPVPGGQPGQPGQAGRGAGVEAVAAWASALTAQQAMRMLQRVGLAAGAVQNSEDVVRDAQHRERHFLHEMDHPDLGVAEYAGPLYWLAKTPATIKRRTPRLGEHSAEILTEWLGLPAEESRAYAWPLLPG